MNAEQAIAALGPEPALEDVIVLLYHEPYKWTLESIRQRCGIGRHQMERMSKWMQRQGKLTLRSRSEAATLRHARRSRQ